MRRPLVLRPEPGASATAERARALGLEPVVLPLFEIEPVAWEAPQAVQFDGLLLTSANAVRFGGDQLEKLRDFKVYAVGGTTAEAARDAGFDVVATGESGVESLLGSIDAPLKLLHLAGEDRKEPGRDGITPLVVYRAKPIEAPDLTQARGAVALIHSPRAGRRFAELVAQRGSMAIAAISPAAADAVGGGWERVEAADMPNDDALLALAARLCNNPRPK